MSSKSDSRSNSFASSPKKKHSSSSDSHSSSSSSKKSRSRSRSNSQTKSKNKYFKNSHNSNKKYVPYSQYLKERLEKRRKLKAPLIWEFTSDEEEYEKDKLYVEMMRKKEFEELKKKIENGICEVDNEEKDGEHQEDPDTSAEITEGKRKKKEKKEKKKRKKSKKSKKTIRNLRKKVEHKHKKSSSSDSRSSSDSSEEKNSSAMDMEDMDEANSDEDSLNGKEKNKEGGEHIENFVGPVPLQIDRNFLFTNIFIKILFCRNCPHK